MQSAGPHELDQMILFVQHENQESSLLKTSNTQYIWIECTSIIPSHAVFVYIWNKSLGSASNIGNLIFYGTIRSTETISIVNPSLL